MILKKHKTKLITCLLTISTLMIWAQKPTYYSISDSLNIQKRNTIIVGETILATGSLIALNQLWYKEYPKSSFHFINDNQQWKQMDKMGHFMSSYYIGKVGKSLLNWSGVSEKNQLIYGATLGFTYLTAIEVLDGFSKEWGASTGDLLANAAGAGFVIGQELLWSEQRIHVKYSFHQTTYAQERPGVLGSNYLEQSLKDYNGQTYWLSANIWSFYKKSNFPKWLNIALGYGAEGMLYGENKAHNLTSQIPHRQFYLSLDVDLTKIKTKSKFLQTVFSVINFIKIPAPTLEINSKKGVKLHYLYF